MKEEQKSPERSKDLNKVIVTTPTRLPQIVSFSPAGDVETNPGPDNANMNWKEKVSAKYYSQEELFSMQ